jgi:type II secretory ATPase GspE/PulE/Tfp pilus assembly ATPase PilB-like protein
MSQFSNGMQGRSAAQEAPAAPALIEQAPEVRHALAELVTAEQAGRLRAAPIGEDGVRLLVAMIDPSDLAAADEISVTTGRPIRRVGITAEAFSTYVRNAYGATAAQMAARLGEGEDEEDLVGNLEAIETDDWRRMAAEPSLINLVNLIILEAIRARASDVHIEPFEKQLRVKYRVDGVLVEQDSPSWRLQPAITSRIKIMGGMNIAERYAPQDGHITLRYEGRKIDLRVSTIPTLYGESIVMRILDKEAIKLDLETLGMRTADRAAIDRLIELPHGMVLVTGPTGSGKTTTLYAALSKLYDPRKKILTIEDPVEYELTGVNQIPVNPKRGLSFASGLRHILRQDPDVIMVGEIRDAETAEIAVRAALTGHLIFTTLHTNDAASAVGRLLDMDVEPFLLASVLEASIAQRLGRRICDHCRQPVAIPEHIQHRLSEVESALFSGGKCFDGAGCDKCDGSGRRGRVGFYEFLEVTGSMRSMIAARSGPREVLRAAGAAHVTMRRDGLEKASAGVTTVDEVLRATQDAGEDA